MDIKKAIQDSGMQINDDLLNHDWRFILLKNFVEAKDNGSDKLDPTDYEEAFELLLLSIIGPNYYPKIDTINDNERVTYGIIAAIIALIQNDMANEKSNSKK